MRSGKLSVGVGSGVAALLLLATGAAPAVADFGKLKTRTATASATGNQGIATATATCPRGIRATGGGFLETTPTITAFPVVYESRKVGQRSWLVSTQQDTMGAPTRVDLTAFVYCRKGAPKTRAAATTVATPAGNQISPAAIATCPSGRRAQAGGFSTPPPVNPGGQAANRVFASQVGGKTSWRATAIGTAPSSLTAYAYCAKASEENQVNLSGIVSEDGNATTTAGAVSTGTARCEGKQRKTLAGGFSSTATASPLSYYQPFESQLTGKSWRQSGVHVAFGSAPAAVVFVSALCG